MAFNNTEVQQGKQLLSGHCLISEQIFSVAKLRQITAESKAQLADPLKDPAVKYEFQCGGARVLERWAPIENILIMPCRLEILLG